MGCKRPRFGCALHVLGWFKGHFVVELGKCFLFMSCCRGVFPGSALFMCFLKAVMRHSSCTHLDLALNCGMFAQWLFLGEGYGFVSVRFGHMVTHRMRVLIGCKHVRLALAWSVLQEQPLLSAISFFFFASACMPSRLHCMSHHLQQFLLAPLG